MKKKKKKRILLKILFSIIVIATCIKIFFSIDNYLYENKIEKMKSNNELLIETKSQVEHKKIDFNDFTINYYVSGDKDSNLVVFLHPAFSDHRAFEQQLDFFSKDFRVITIDLIGHGLSQANKSKDKIDSSINHINKILETEGYSNAHFVGVSMGSLIAQYYALNYPEKIKSLTALGSYNINKENKEVAKAQRGYNLNLMFRAVFSMKAFRKYAASVTAETEKAKAQFYESTSFYQRKSLLVMQGLQNVIKDRETTRPKYPLLILNGEHDIDLAVKMAKEWHSEMENCKFEIIKGAGHCANMDNPEEFNKMVKSFIKENN